LGIASDISFSSELDIPNPDEIEKNKLNEIRTNMENLGFDVNEIERLLSYMKRNEDFLMLIHTIKLNSGSRIPKNEILELKGLLEKNSKLNPDEFKSKK
jgi:hypothetical protein